MVLFFIYKGNFRYLSVMADRERVDDDEKYMMDGNFPIYLWNMFNHKGVTTNNNAESLNNKLGNKNK